MRQGQLPERGGGGVEGAFGGNHIEEWLAQLHYIPPNKPTRPRPPTPRSGSIRTERTSPTQTLPRGELCEGLQVLGVEGDPD